MKMLFSLYAILICSLSFSQKQDTVKDKNRVFIIVEKSVDFPGGMNKFYEFLGKTIQLPDEVLKGKVSGKVIVKFVVEPNGSLSSFEIVKSLSQDCDAEVIRVLKKSPKWRPGEQYGRKVRQALTLPFTFRMSPK